MKMMMRRMCAIVPTPHDAVSDLASVVKVLQKRVIRLPPLFDNGKRDKRKLFGSDYRLISENHHRFYLNRVLILKPQSLWLKERSVMSSEDLKDWKEEVSIRDPECQMQRLKLSILAVTIKKNWKQVRINHVPYIK